MGIRTANYYFAKIQNVTINTFYLADLGLLYPETNTDAKLWDCDQSSHHNRQGQRKVHKMKHTEAVHSDLTLSQMKECSFFYKILEILIVLNTVIRDKGNPQQFHAASEDAWIPGLALPAKWLEGLRRSSHFSPQECLLQSWATASIPLITTPPMAEIVTRIQGLENQPHKYLLMRDTRE